VGRHGGCGRLPGQSGEQPPTRCGSADQVIVPVGVIGPDAAGTDKTT